MTAMLVVTLTTLVVSSLFWRTNVTVRSVENRLALAQTHWVERGVIDWARVVLAVDGATSQSDDMGETWAQPVLDTKLDETVTGGAKIGDLSRSAMLAGQVYDAQARFNLNNLLDDADGQTTKALERLLELVGQPTSLAAALRTRIQQSYPRTVEGKVIRPTAMPLLRTRDLRFVPGFSGDVIAALEPYVIFLPLRETGGPPTAGVSAFQRSPLNVNTAEPLVLAAMLPDLGLDGARRFTSQARRQYRTLEQALQALGEQENPLPAGHLSVSSAYFLVRGVVRYDRVEDQTDTLLFRSGNRVEIVWQQRS